jgi:osmoprotectant transport system substrate-binding protein
MVARRQALALLFSVVTACAGCATHHTEPDILVAGGTSQETALIGHLYAAAMRTYGTAAAVEETSDPLDLLDEGNVTVVPGFTGTFLQRFEPDATARADEQVYREMVSSLPEGLSAGDYTTSAQDKPSLLVTAATAKAWGGEDLSAAVRHCAEVTPGGLDGSQDPAQVGTCTLAKPRLFRDEGAMWAALRAGQINAAWTTTAAPDIPPDLTMLADRTSLIRAENVVPVYRRNVLNEAQVLALNELAGVLDTAGLAEMRAQVARGADPGAVADAWLAAHPLRD